MKHTSWRYRFVAAVLILVAFMFLWFRLQISLDLRSQPAERMSVLEALHGRGAPLTPADAEYIESWMTFDYLNTAFKLPPQYLSRTLKIDDPRYPHLSIGRFARDTGTTTPATLDAVRAAVRVYVGASGV